MLTDLLQQVKAVAEGIRGKGGVAWYRGHREAKWGLTSTLHRHVERMVAAIVNPPEQKGFLREEAKTLYRRFKDTAWSLLTTAERSEWGTLFAMQHHGSPTRLLPDER